MADLTLEITLPLPPVLGKEPGDFFTKLNELYLRPIRQELKEAGGTSKLRRHDDSVWLELTGPERIVIDLWTNASKLVKVINEAAAKKQKIVELDRERFRGLLQNAERTRRDAAADLLYDAIIGRRKP